MKQTSLFATLLLACALPAVAQDIKPGLWELSSQFTSPDAKMQAAMSSMQQRLGNLPPEQRAQLEQSLRQNGVQLDISGGGKLRTKMCMTKEMAARKEFPVQQGDCTQQYTPQAGGKGLVSFSCTKPRLSGTGDITMIDDSNYRANLRVTSADQSNQVVDTSVTGHWLGADCGGLKPLAAPK